MKKFAWPVILYLSVILVVFGRALVPGTGEMIWGDDIHRQYYFYRQFFNNFLNQGIWPWWNPYNFAGAPFMANPIVNIWYPPTWLYVVLPLNLAYSWHIAFHLLWAMLGMYTLLRRVMTNFQFPISNDKKSLITHHSLASLRLRSGSFSITFSSWLAGLIFGLSGFFTARIWAGHVDVIAAASWMPWVVYAFGTATSDRGQGTRKYIVFAGGALAMQILAGYQTMAMMTLIAVFIVSVSQCVSERTVKPLLTAGLCALLGLALAAIQLVPTQEFFRQSIRTFDFPYSWNSYGSLTIESLKQFFDPFIFGDQLTYAGPSPNFAEHAFFVGRVGMLLVFGVFLFRLPRLLRLLRSPMVLAFGCIAIFGLWVSLGSNAPIDLQYILWKFVPMYKYLRIPPRHLILVVFGFSGMMGMAMNFLISKSQILNPKWFDFAHHLFEPEPQSRRPESIEEQYQSTNVLNSKRFGIWNFLHFGFVWNLMLGAWNLLPSLFVLLIAAEMILYARHFIALKPIPEMRHDPALIKILQRDKEPYRILTNFGVWVPPRDSFDFESGMNYRISNATGYDPTILRSYYEFFDIANGSEPGTSILHHDVQVPYLNVSSSATNFLNIKYILHPRAYDPLFGTKDPRFRLIREDVVRDYRLYENTMVLPRFFFEENKDEKVRVKKYSPNEIVLSTQSPVGATLMSSEVYYPGWEGFIDGKKVDVMKVNHAFRALFIPAGNHTVIYRYNPRIFVIGGVISLVFVMICVVILQKRPLNVQ